MNWYNVGQSIRLYMAAEELGFGPQDAPATLTVIVADSGLGPAKTLYTITATVVHDETGKYHADFVIPDTTSNFGKWTHRWFSTGVQADQNARAEDQFGVRVPAF